MKRRRRSEIDPSLVFWLAACAASFIAGFLSGATYIVLRFYLS